ncbi:hypothetical protein SmJEL517_g02760 [Synchytrium microbalum]|uniref:Cullin-5 n=1 Tax=Synchytrium microbalum TaxID=1806994 RepID=A0A507C9M3_9FUNG|nr:uncharacterized protein SmJEL517_g02760 [Synchytrium microbalum]TPX34674.1 hypothetical protein SmJEL517_g02760 [Synchytrium microbalum]
MSLRPKKVVFETVFPDFCKELSNMYEFNNIHVSGIDMFQMVYDMCTAAPRPHTEALFDGISDFLTRHATLQLNNLLQFDDVVTAYATEWDKYSTASRFANVICEYLNRLSNNTARSMKRKRPSVEAHAFAIWRDCVVYEIKKTNANRLILQIMSLVKQDRDGQIIPHEATRKTIDSFVQLNRDGDTPFDLYINEFENVYLAQTREYYETESNTVISTLNISGYMFKANTRLQEEVIRNQRYCDAMSHDKIIRECEAQYIAAHQQRVHAHFESMVEHENTSDCNMAYNLLSRIPNGVDPLLEIFEKYIARVGKAMVAALGTTVTKEAKDYVEMLMDLHSKYLKFATDAFRTIVNDTTSNPNARGPEVLARYCDSILRKTTKTNLTDGELEDRISRMMTLFKYVDDKDVFQKFYSKMLARRLIFESSVSDEAEISMISKLKVACGVEYTTKLQRMFTDMNVSNDLNATFKSFVNNNGVRLAVESNMMVLTAGSWPTFGKPLELLSLPAELERSVLTFTNFYIHHHNGRKLTWLHQLARADVKLSGFDKRYELNVSVPQLSLLLMLNDEKKPTWKELKEALKMNHGDLSKHAKPLLDIRLISTSSEALGDDATISVGQEFSSKRTKIKLSAMLQLESPQENDSTRRAVDEDRAIYLQAAIVRIMKSRKRLAHQRLVQEVLAQVSSRFAPPVPAIKKAIESLLEKGYIERPGEAPDHYDYLA